MALIERIMRYRNDDGTVAAEQRADAISVHGFFAACHEVIMGRMSGAELRAGFGIRNTLDASGRSDEQDLAAIVAAAPLAANVAGRAQYVESIHGIFILSEIQFPGYITPAQIRAKLGI